MPKPQTFFAGPRKETAEDKRAKKNARLLGLSKTPRKGNAR